MEVYYLERKKVYHTRKECLTLKNSKGILKANKETLKNRRECRMCNKKITYNRVKKDIEVLK